MEKRKATEILKDPKLKVEMIPLSRKGQITNGGGPPDMKVTCLETGISAVGLKGNTHLKKIEEAYEKIEGIKNHRKMKALEESFREARKEFPGGDIETDASVSGDMIL